MPTARRSHSHSLRSARPTTRFPAAVLLLATLAGCGNDPIEHEEIEAELLVRFDDFDLPEGIDMSSDGTLYVGILTTGEIKAIGMDGSQSTVATVVLDGGFMPGLTLSHEDEIYVAVSASERDDADGHGVLKVGLDGAVERFAEFPDATFPNHITFDAQGDMYVSASSPGSLYRVDGESGEVTLWSDHPRLHGKPVMALDGLVLGANGSALSADETELYITNSSTHEILRIEIMADGGAGIVDCYAGWADDCEIDVTDHLQGPDGLAFDDQGRLYVASGLNDTLLRIDVDGRVTALSAGAPLEWPTVLVFGTTPETATTLFATNIDISRLFGAMTDPAPGVVMFDVDAEGQ